NKKSFQDGEMVKEAFVEAAESQDNKRIQDMPLLARTVHDHTIMMANQVEETQVKDINAAPFFSLALDESTDVTHLSQFSVIARYAAGDTLREESLAVLPIKGSTRGEDLFKSFMEFAHEKNLPMDKLLSVCTDGGEKQRICGFPLHSTPGGTLCSDVCDGQLGEVMSLVIRVINFIVARALNDRQFKTLLDEVGNNYHGLLLHSNVRWLSRGKVLSSFATCLNEIRTFLEIKGIEHPELAETEWLLKFYYVVDMTEHLNQLNVKMQGIGNTLELFIMDLETIHHPSKRVFTEYSRLSYIPDVSLRDFEAEVADLKASDMWVNKFKSLNDDLERIAREKTELASKHMWTEMKKLQPEDELIIKTWNALPVTYNTLKCVSIAVLTMFGSTYSCEQSFSHLKNIKSNLRSRLTDESLNACIKLNLTKYQPDYKAISKSMQHQKSH
uniref:HAT C-terminal dimerisation domain-containing protein n=1 Tax=Gouania willdenowi TaxID=441366 RepID=A0A8C5EAW6_GOUWI